MRSSFFLRLITGELLRLRKKKTQTVIG